MDHLDGVFVGEDGEGGLGLEEEYLAAFVVFAQALYAAACHHDAALAVGQREELVAGAVEDAVALVLGGELLSVLLEDDDGSCLVLPCMRCRGWTPTGRRGYAGVSGGRSSCQRATVRGRS